MFEFFGLLLCIAGYRYYGTLYYAWTGTTQITKSKNQTVLDFMGFLKASSGLRPYGLGEPSDQHFSVIRGRP
jgi:hypothetical protein